MSMTGMRVVIVALIAAVLLAACGPGAHAVNDGNLRDTIFAIEAKQNGSHFIWMTHDDVGVYCTMNKSLFQQAAAIFNDKSRPPEVILSYISLNVGSAENPAINVFGTSGCSHPEATIYIITGIELVAPPPVR